jgi:hypothetical protein
MKDVATKSFQQSYNPQAAVDEKAQIFIASGITQHTNDKLQVKPLVKTILSTDRQSLFESHGHRPWFTLIELKDFFHLFLWSN